MNNNNNNNYNNIYNNNKIQKGKQTLFSLEAIIVHIIIIIVYFTAKTFYE